MVIYECIPDEFPDGVALCIGKFDGFHRGHRRLIDAAKNTGRPVTVLTFVFNRTDTIDSVPEKRRLAENLGVDHYIEIEAGEDFFSLSPESFIEEIVRKKLHARHVIVGEDFRFGHKRTGDIHTLREAAERNGYELHAVPKLCENGSDISSSRIRACISEGSMEETEQLLGRPFRIEGKVSDGNHIGRKMGVPTANLEPADGKVLPPYGVYAVRVLMNGRVYDAIANLGIKPTVGNDNPVGLEVNLFDTTGDLYGRWLSVSFVSFLRTEQRFDSIESLHAQIEKDIEEAKRRLADGEGRPGI